MGDCEASAPTGIRRRDWLAAATGLLAWPMAGQATVLGQQRSLFGTRVELLLPSETPAEIAGAIWQGLARLNTEWNAWKPGELSRVNQAFRAGRPAPASAALRAMVQRAARLEQASAGLFNPAIGRLVGAWGFHHDELVPGPRPAPSTVARCRRAAPSLSQVVCRDDSLWTDNPWLQLDFGAYAKGVAIDAALDRLQRLGVRHALLNLGGNLAAMGAPGGRPWQVGVRDPNGPGLLAAVAVQGREAVVTSGSYERMRWVDGQRCSHIIDPGTGAPAPAFASVTVLHRDAGLADAAATALLVAGPARWERVAERMQVDQVLLVDHDGRLQATPRLAPRLQRRRIA